MKDPLKKPSNKSFGILFFIVFFAIGIYLFFVKNEVFYNVFLVSLLFLILGLKNSKILTPLNILWLKFGFLLGKFISPIVIGIIFFVVVTPTGLIMKLFKKDLLRLKKSKSNSYWIRRSNEGTNMKDQF